MSELPGHHCRFIFATRATPSCALPNNTTPYFKSAMPRTRFDTLCRACLSYKITPFLWHLNTRLVLRRLSPPTTQPLPWDVIHTAWYSSPSSLKRPQYQMPRARFPMLPPYLPPYAAAATKAASPHQNTPASRHYIITRFRSADIDHDTAWHTLTMSPSFVARARRRVSRRFHAAERRSRQTFRDIYYLYAMLIFLALP